MREMPRGKPTAAKKAPAAAEAPEETGLALVVDSSDNALLQKLEGVTELSREALKEAIASVHGGPGKNKLSDEDVRARRDGESEAEFRSLVPASERDSRCTALLRGTRWHAGALQVPPGASSSPPDPTA